MDNTEFRRVAHRFVEWIADYYDNIESYPVSSQVKPGEILNKLKKSPPDVGESIEDIFMDFERTIVPGITHWQHPHFYGTYPAQTTYPSLLAEMLTLAMSPQSTSWHCSPAATELELRVTDWLRQILSLPDTFTGTTQESASISTLIAILTAREKWSEFHVNQKGLYKQKRFTIYTSEQSHPWIVKAIRISGLGQDNIRYIETNSDFELDTKELQVQIEKDKKQGCIPLMVIATMGTQNTGAIDSLKKIGTVARKFKLWMHVDAAYCGAAMVLPEHNHFLEGIKQANSIVIDPHKWLLTSSECSVYFVKDVKALQKTLGMLPEYINQKEDKKIVNYRDRSISQGRRFRALKLWFVLREYGVQGIQRFIRNHLDLAEQLTDTIVRSPDFELLAPVNFNVICFRYVPTTKMSAIQVDSFNHQLLDRLNASGKIYLTPVDLDNRYGLRLVIGQTWVTRDSINAAWQRIVLTAQQLSGEM